MRARGREGVSTQLTPPLVLALWGTKDSGLPFPGTFRKAGTATYTAEWEDLRSPFLPLDHSQGASPISLFWKEMEWAG